MRETASTYLLLRVSLFRHSDLTGQLGQIRDPYESVMEKYRLLLHRKPLGRVHSPGAHHSLLRQWCRKRQTLKIQWQKVRNAPDSLLTTYNNMTALTVAVLSDGGVWRSRPGCWEEPNTRQRATSAGGPAPHYITAELTAAFARLPRLAGAELAYRTVPF